MSRRVFNRVTQKFRSVFGMFRFITSHPLNENRKLASIRRFLAWQLASRLSSRPIEVGFVNGSKLLVSRGMTGATGNIYTGLHEFEDMSFVLHALRRDDTFVDVGANIGSYTVLAGAVAGATCLAFEPIPATYHHLVQNINLNDLASRVVAENIGIGSAQGELRFTYGLDTINHVLAADEHGSEGIVVPVVTLDEAVGQHRPTVIKIDVEGFETKVVEGAQITFAQESLLAVVMELNGSGARYGFDENALHERMLAFGFRPFGYAPFSRELISLKGKNALSGNTIYVRNVDLVNQRVRSAKAFVANGRSI